MYCSSLLIPLLGFSLPTTIYASSDNRHTKVTLGKENYFASFRGLCGNQEETTVSA